MQDLKKLAVFDNLGSDSFLNRRNIKTIIQKITIDNVDNDDGYLLKIACKYDLFDLVKIILLKGSDISRDDYKCIQVCCDYKNFNLLLFLFKSMTALMLSKFIDYIVSDNCNWTQYQKHCVKNSLHVIRNETNRIHRIPIVKCDKENEKLDTSCKICFRKFNNTNCLPYTSACGHVYCKDCILKIDICGICRSEMYECIRLYF